MRIHITIMKGDVTRGGTGGVVLVAGGHGALLASREATRLGVPIRVRQGHISPPYLARGSVLVQESRGHRCKSISISTLRKSIKTRRLC